MARQVRPEIIARIIPSGPQPVPFPGAGAQPEPPPVDEAQQAALGVLADALAELQVPNPDGDARAAADALLGDGGSVLIEVRRSSPGEVWVRVS